jgi:hypothetical protein
MYESKPSLDPSSEAKRGEKRKGFRETEPTGLRDLQVEQC